MKPPCCFHPGGTLQSADHALVSNKVWHMIEGLGDHREPFLYLMEHSTGRGVHHYTGWVDLGVALNHVNPLSMKTFFVTNIVMNLYCLGRDIYLSTLQKHVIHSK